jgi:hypothetical protein
MVQAEVPKGRSGAESPQSDPGLLGGYILSGLIVFGGLGMWLDHVLGLSVLTPLGLVLGAIAGGYLVYVKVVRVPSQSPAAGRDESSASVDEGEHQC